MLKVEESFQKEIDLESMNESQESVKETIQDQSLSQSRQTLSDGRVTRSGIIIKEPDRLNL